MALPLKPPIEPQLALSRKTLPVGDGWAYEPKWDGFRAIAFLDNGELFLQSRNGKPLARYFPELEFPGAGGKNPSYVLDGELVICDSEGREEFDALQNRIHPAASRIGRLSKETPAVFRAFDVLAIGRKKLIGEPLRARRAALEDLIGGLDGARRSGRGMAARLAAGTIELTPFTEAPAEAEPWLEGAEGVIAKELDATYLPGKRRGMVKVKRVRTIDAIVMGWRPGKEAGTVGSLILGLHEPGGELRAVGHTSGFKASEKKELVSILKPYESGERGTADPSRWSADRDLEWVSLRPELVVEVTFDHVSAGRIRHGAKVQRWRDDKDPEACGVDQLDQ